MKRFLFFLFVYISFFGQSLRIKSGAGFSPGFQKGSQSVLIHGLLGWQGQETIELRGEGFFFLNSFGNTPVFSKNHQLFAGAFYIFSNKNIQPYFGFQPGIALSQGLSGNKLTVNPVVSFAGGITLYADKLFFLYVDVRQIFGKHLSDNIPLSLREFRFSLGSGFYIAK